MKIFISTHPWRLQTHCNLLVPSIFMCYYFTIYFRGLQNFVMALTQLRRTIQVVPKMVLANRQSVEPIVMEMKLFRIFFGESGNGKKRVEFSNVVGIWNIVVCITLLLKNVDLASILNTHNKLYVDSFTRFLCALSTFRCLPSFIRAYAWLLLQAKQTHPKHPAKLHVL